jgi:hypothetical protein
VNKIVIECLRFDGIGYDFWKTKMQGYLEYYLYDVENAYTTPYVALANGNSTFDEIKVHEEKNRAKFILKNSLSHFEQVRVMNMKIAKDV